ncbi:MAG: GAF domain-containing protein, partial [Anaerolineae bacterium]|nr:GAF domain-containing protein [Anaerolineae bacterium]
REEQDLFAEVAGDLAFALHSLQQEEALRESEERFRLLAERSLTGVYLIQDGILRYVNPAAAHVFGYEPEELINRLSPLEVVAPEDRELVREMIRRRMEGEVESVHYTITGLRKDGSRFPCEVLGTQIEYQGRPAILGTLIDLTDRVRAEEAIRRRAEQTEALRQIALELFSQSDLNALISSIVQRAVELVGGSAGGLYLYRPEKDILEWVISIGSHLPPVGTCLRLAESGIARRVWETGRPFWVDDYRHWEGRAAIYADRPWTAVIGIPVRRGEEMLGVLIVLADPPRTFSQEDADLLEVFAAQAAIALTNARLYETLRQEREQLDFLHRLGQRLAGTLDVANVAQEALGALCGITGAQQGVVYVLEPETSRLRLVAAFGHGEAQPEELDQRLQLQVGRGLAGWVALHQQTALVDDVLQDERWLVFQGIDDHVRSAVSVPLRFREELVGVMSLGGTERAAFTADHVRLLEAAGAVLAGALLNARLYEAERERARRMAVVAQVSERLAASLDPATVYRELVEGVVQAFGYDYAGLMLLDEKAGELEFVAGAGVWAGLTPMGYRQKITEGMIGWVAQTGETLLANDVSQEPRYIAPYLTETRAELDVPLRYHGQLIGVLTIQSARVNTFTPLDVATLEALADQAATAIANARLYEQERRARERVEALYRIGQIVNSTLDPDVILDRLTEEAVRATGATHGSVLVPDPEREIFERRSLRGYSPEERERARSYPLSLTQGINSRAYRTRLAQYTPDVREDPDYFTLIPTTRSELVIPILRGEQFLGNLDLQSPQVDAFRNVDMEFLRALADQVAIALENARLYEEERRRAQEQETLTLIATALNTLEIRRAFPILVQGLRTLTGCDRVAVALLTEDGAHFRISVLETSIPVLGLGTVRPLSTSPVWANILSGKPHFCPDMSAEVEYAAIRALYNAGFRSYVSLPLRAGGRIIGALHVVSLREHNFRREQVYLLQQIADALANAIENERLYRAEREQRELAQALAEAAGVIARTLDPEQIMAQILEQVARVVPGDAFNVMLVEDGAARIVRWRGYEQFGAEARVASLAFSVTEVPNLWRMVQTCQPTLIPDTEADSDWVRVEGLEWIRSYVAAPIVVRGITVGFLNVDGTRPNQFGPADAARLKAFADHTAIALENAWLYQELRRYASNLEEQVRERTAQLGAQYARLEAILRSTSDGIILTDREGEILQANPVAQQWLQNLSPQNVSLLQDAIRDLVQKASDRPTTVLELPGLDLEIRAAPLEDPTGEGAAVVVLHDVTQYKTLERLRARFISSISHELRTPVSTIKLYAEMMRRHPERWREFLEVLEREAEWQAQLVEEVLEISRLDAGRVEFRLRAVSLNLLAERTVATFQMMAREKGLTLEFSPSPEEPVALADEIRLTQVLKNLLVNAINYTPSGGRVIVRTGKEELEDRLWAILEVSDTGIGIAPEELPHIFDRFFRSERVRELRMSGTGLGLSIVKEIVDRHGGRVTVQSEVGKGSTFTVWLPVSEG